MNFTPAELKAFTAPYPSAMRRAPHWGLARHWLICNKPTDKIRDPKVRKDKSAHGIHNRPESEVDREADQGPLPGVQSATGL